MALRVGINALYLIPGGVGGTEIYLRFLLRALERVDPATEYAVFLNRETGTDLVPPSPRFCAVRCHIAARFRPARILFEQLRLPGLLEGHAIDVVLNPGYTASLRARCPQVTVFHDLQHKIHPEFFRVFELPFWNVLLAGSVSRSDRLIAVSASTARDLAKNFPQSQGRVATIPHGVDPEFFRIGRERLARPPRPFILTVSTLHPHKNIERTLDAFHRFRSVHPEFRLVIAGLKGFATYRIENRVRGLGLRAHVDLTGWIPRSELYQLYAGASAFIAPSLFEGFGLPLVEAMAAGLSVACSAIPPFRETAEGVARLFDPRSVDEMTEALEFITHNDDFRGRSAVEGPRRAGTFDWDAAARATLAELHAAARVTQPARERTRETDAPLSPMKTAAPAPSPPVADDREEHPTRRSV
jgi:glycosyltransferase involved in cell wall biosynthesis